MFGIMTTAKKRSVLIDAIDSLQGKMTERGSLSSNAEKLGKEILRVFRSEISNGQPTSEGKNLTISFMAGGSGKAGGLDEILAKEGVAKSVTDLNAAFAGKIIITKNDDGTYTFLLKASAK